MTPPISRRQLHPEGSRTDAALLPCPFCGSDAAYTYNELHEDNSMATCNSCGATAFWKKWNTRAAEYDASRNSSDAQVSAIGEPVALMPWMRDRGRVVELAEHLESIGWQPDAEGDAECADQAAAMSADVIRKVLLPLLDAPQPPSAPSQSGEVAKSCPQCGARWPTPQCDWCQLVLHDVSNTPSPPRDSPREAE